MKKALEVLFGIKPANSPFIPNDLAFSTCMPRTMPNMLEWFEKHKVGILTDKQSTNVPVRMGNIIKYVDLRSIKSM